MSLIRKILRVDGSETILDGPQSMTQLRQALGADELDTVPLRHLGHPLHVMLCDDNGYETITVERGPGHIELVPVRALKPVNYAATDLYHQNCKPGTLHQIVGDVAIVPDDDYPPATQS